MDLILPHGGVPSTSPNPSNDGETVTHTLTPSQKGQTADASFLLDDQGAHDGSNQIRNNDVASKPDAAGT